MKIFLWGTGCGASQAIEKGISLTDIAGFIDSHPQEDTFLGKPVLLPQEAAELHPDLIVVTTRHADQVSAACESLGIPREIILYLKDCSVLCDRNAHCMAAENILGKSLLKELIPRQHLVTEPEALRDSVLSSENDYVRLSQLELLSREIRNIPGDLAELGVYKGAFAACMNRLLPERTLYLFDSFQGFVPQEGEREKESRTCTDAFLAAHRNTASQTVLNAMPYPQKVILKVGYFPESLQGLETRFSLVSLDADFLESTLEGLRYFYPRLNPGGYLMLHDWGSRKLTGVRKALALYRKEYGSPIPAVPIPDLGNSLIIQKI